MDAIFTTALKDQGWPVVLIIILMAVNFYERRSFNQDMIQQVQMGATLKSVADTLASLCTEVRTLTLEVMRRGDKDQ